MKAIECLDRLKQTSLMSRPLKFCFVDENKRPFKINGEMARPNHIEDFSDMIDLLNSDKINDFAGVGISIQASNIFAIDVDHCFVRDDDLIFEDDRAKEILNIFENKAYCEYSFSGTGLRVLFDAKQIEDYSKYYIKNSEKQIEFYQPGSSFRYVTLTGNTLSDNFSAIEPSVLKHFLEKYMKRPVRTSSNTVVKVNDQPIEQLMPKIKWMYLTNHSFQELWFGKAPGSGKDESERDYHLLTYLYEQVTQNKNKIKQLFEMSPYFKSKDWKHIKKWQQQDFRYFNYVFNKIEECHQ